MSQCARRILEDIVAIAGEAGSRFAEKEYSIEAKAPHDYVTAVDESVQAEIISYLSERYPEAVFIAEEQDNGNLDEALERGCFIIDPIDGTLNFLNGSPLCCVSIAYAEQGEILAGVVHAPLLGETFSALKGEGAWLGCGKEGAEGLSCSELPLELGVVQVEGDWHADRQYIADFALATRSLGSCALASVWTAAGRSAGYISVPEAKIWDMAAARLICEESGLRVYEPDGRDHVLKYQGQFFVAREEDKEAFVKMIATCEAHFVPRADGA